MMRAVYRIFLFGVVLAILGGLSGLGILVYFSQDLPRISTLSDYRPSIPSQILSKDGTVLADIGRENRSIVEIDEMPKLVVDAFLSAEDASFYEHSGVDYLGILRALIVNIKAGRVIQGGSTITQQVAKSLLLSRERSITRKIKDFLLARKIEEKFTKEEILYLYLNQVYLGGGYYGIRAAIQGYFDKTLEEVTVAEAAMIAGLLVAPGKYSPYINPEYAKKRQAYVLDRMYQNGKITKEEFETAKIEKIKYRIRKSKSFKAPYFTDWVRQRVVEKIGEEEFLNGGYTVKTTLNYQLQKKAEEEVLKGVYEIDRRQGFRGPLTSISMDEESISKLYSGVREEAYQEISNFFILTDDMMKKNEFEFDSAIAGELAKSAIEDLKSGERLNLILGHKEGYKENEFYRFVAQKDKRMDALVLRVNDRARIVFVSIGGVRGVIDYEGFRWAHERKIASDFQAFPYVTRPSTILKPGDIVKVSVRGIDISLKKLIFNQYLERITKLDKKEEFLNQKFLSLNLEQEPEAQAALVSISPTTGEIVSLVGGTNFEKSKFNRAIQSKRQPGSSFKPFLFAAALENGFSPASIILDSPEALAGVDESLSWKPRNYDGKFKGRMTFRQSLEISRNIPTIKISQKMGVKTIHDFANRIGLKAKLDPDLSLALGSFGITLVDLVSSYAIFPSGGKLVIPSSIVEIRNREDEVIPFEEKFMSDDSASEIVDEEKVKESFDSEIVENQAEDGNIEVVEPELKNPFIEGIGGDQVYDKRLAYIMTNLLKGVVQNGTGRRARAVSPFIGGKTGTTNDYVDAWFLGFSSNLATGVWTGMDDNTTMGWGETGSKSALPIWKAYMQEGLKQLGESDFRQPRGIVNVRINKNSGELTGSGDPDGFLEAFVEGYEPGASIEKDSKVEPEESTRQILGDDDYFRNQ